MLKRFNDAIKSYDEGLAVTPDDPALVKGRGEAVRDKDAPIGGYAAPSSGVGGGSGGNPLTEVFGPSLIPKIAADPKTRPYLDDKDFMAKLEMLQKNPNSLQQCMSDPRIMEVLSMALGGNVEFRDPDSEKVSTKKPESVPVKEPEPVVEVEEDTSWMTPEELQAHGDKKKAITVKNEGNVCLQLKLVVNRSLCLFLFALLSLAFSVAFSKGLSP